MNYDLKIFYPDLETLPIMKSSFFYVFYLHFEHKKDIRLWWLTKRCSNMNSYLLFSAICNVSREENIWTEFARALSQSAFNFLNSTCFFNCKAWGSYKHLLYVRWRRSLKKRRWRIVSPHYILYNWVNRLKLLSNWFSAFNIDLIEGVENLEVCIKFSANASKTSLNLQNLWTL